MEISYFKSNGDYGSELCLFCPVEALFSNSGSTVMDQKVFFLYTEIRKNLRLINVWDLDQLELWTSWTGISEQRS